MRGIGSRTRWATGRPSRWAGELSTWTEYPYGCECGAPVGRLWLMTTHRASKPLADPNRPVERAVTAALVLAVLAGLGWIAGMLYTVAGWS